jgi:hypothetical protein
MRQIILKEMYQDLRVYVTPLYIEKASLLHIVATVETPIYLILMTKHGASNIVPSQLVFVE